MAVKSAVDILIAARGRIADPLHWTNGTWASADGVRRCAVSALCVDPPDSARHAAYRYLWRATGNYGPVAVNDNRGHAAVLEMFDAAIEDAREEARS